MPVRTPRSVHLLTGLALAVAGLVAGAGCSSPQTADSDTRARAEEHAAERARQVAAAWDGSAAAAAWRKGFHPMGDLVQLPRGGLRGEADERADQEGSFVLEGALPAGRPRDGRVVWAGGGSLALPLVGAGASYATLAGGRVGGEPQLTVTGAKPGEMTVATSRGPATVPAWLFTLKGYDAPLKQAAVLPSKLSRPPIGQDLEAPGDPLDRLVRMSEDGRSATVVALHGACDDGPVVDVLETRGSVVLSASVKERENVGLCTKQLKHRQVTVKLDRPLGDRVLLDAHTGRPVPYKPPYGPAHSWS